MTEPHIKQKVEGFTLERHVTGWKQKQSRSLNGTDMQMLRYDWERRKVC